MPEQKINESPKEIRDSEAETEDEDVSLASHTRQTELEIALPPVKTDKEAIAEYDAFKAAQGVVPLDAEGRLEQRKWIKGKSSIYVDAFNLALETVLEDEGHLFDEDELGVFQQWREMTYEAQYLYDLLWESLTRNMVRTNSCTQLCKTILTKDRSMAPNQRPRILQRYSRSSQCR